MTDVCWKNRGPYFVYWFIAVIFYFQWISTILDSIWHQGERGGSVDKTILSILANRYLF